MLYEFQLVDYPVSFGVGIEFSLLYLYIYAKFVHEKAWAVILFNSSLLTMHDKTTMSEMARAQHSCMRMFIVVVTLFYKSHPFSSHRWLRRKPKTKFFISI